MKLIHGINDESGKKGLLDRNFIFFLFFFLFGVSFCEVRIEFLLFQELSAVEYIFFTKILITSGFIFLT